MQALKKSIIKIFINKIAPIELVEKFFDIYERCFIQKGDFMIIKKEDINDLYTVIETYFYNSLNQEQQIKFEKYRAQKLQDYKQSKQKIVAVETKITKNYRKQQQAKRQAIYEKEQDIEEAAAKARQQKWIDANIQSKKLKQQKIEQFKIGRRQPEMQVNDDVLLQAIFDDDIQTQMKGLKFKSQNTQFKAQRTYRHTAKKINGIENHMCRCEFNNTIETNYSAIIDNNIEQILDQLLEIQQRSNLPFKVSVYLRAEVSEVINDETMYNIAPIKLDFIPVNDLETSLNLTLQSFQGQIDNQIQKLGNSSLKFIRFIDVYVLAIQYQQQAVGSYIQLEGLLRDKKCCINFQNDDDECAIYCFMYFYYVNVLNKSIKNPQRTTQYKYTIEEGILTIKQIHNEVIDKSFKIGNVKFPCNLTDIDKIAKGFGFTYSLFEHQSVTEEGKERIQVRVVFNEKQREGVPHIDLLMNKKDENNKINTHLMVVKNFNGLINHNDKHKKYYCRNCMNYFYKEAGLINHERYCYEKESPSNDEYPEANTKVKFESFQKQMQLPFFMVADFESFIVPVSGDGAVETINDIEEGICHQTKTKKLAKHQLASYGIQVYDEYGLLKKHYYEYVKQDNNDNVIDNFLKTVEHISKKITYIINNTNIPYNETDETRKMRSDAKKCYLCDKAFTPKNYAVVDHNHLTGEIRGIAHNNCNLHFHLQKSKIPVIFHNLKGYDSHMIVKQIGEYMKATESKGKIDCIANNSEKFMSIGWGQVRFIDSLQFMASSLENLGKNLSVDQKQYTMSYLQKKFGSVLSKEELESIINKGKFPYSWFSDISKLDHEGLPSIESFHDDLNNKDIKPEDYEEAVTLFNKLGFKTFREWLLLYQTLDIKILTDVWINFRDLCIKNYKLEPAHYFTSPGLAWDAMLKLTGIELDLITDPEMYLMFERQSRGGISTTGNVRYAKANNVNCVDYNESEDYVQLMYLDANNLYGQAMCQKLPFKDFSFIKEDELMQYGADFILNYKNRKTGYVYEVDLEYPTELHDKHNAYPLAPEQLVVNYEMISKYNKDAISTLKKENDVKIIMGKQHKLTPNLMNKQRYVCNIRNLKLYLEQGLVLTKIHRVIKFEQKDFMKQYIELNTSLRQQAKNDFEKDFFKLMNNSVFGKTMENVRKRANFELVYSEKRMKKIINSRYFKNFISISNNLALVQKHQKTVKLNKPAYCGMQILDESKITMYDFYYNHFVHQFKKVDLIMTDTDSLFMAVHCDKNKDVYDSMIQNADYYDFSNVEKGPLYNKVKTHCETNNIDLKTFLNKNKAVVGKMKNEVPDTEIAEAVSIKAKCYDYITVENKCSKKLKGIKRNVVQNVVTHEDYKNCIFNKKVLNVEQKSLRSYNHEVFTISQGKLALQYFNDKRFILEDGINSYAYGHHKIGTQ